MDSAGCNSMHASAMQRGKMLFKTTNECSNFCLFHGEARGENREQFIQMKD